MPQTIVAKRPSTPAARAGSKATDGVPIDLQSRTQRRLSIFALVLLINASVSFLVAPLVWRALGYTDVGLIRLAQLGLIAASLAMFLFARYAPVSRAVLDAGLGFEVLLCYVSALGYFDLVLPGAGPLAPFGPAHLFIVAYPLIVPSPPRRALMAALASAATVPLSLATLEAIGRAEVPGAAYVGPTMIGLFSAAFAIAGSRVVHQLTRDVAAAREIGSYRLETLLGQGGMGEVWRANHRMLARPAAIKLIRQDVSGSDPASQERVLARFEREAQVTASLRCPHTIALYDFGVSNDGTFYYVMELLDGLDAQALVERFGPLPAARAVHLLRQMCESLAEAHDAGLVHRDIKPSNIFVCRYGRAVDFVKVLDFGLVKPREPDADPSPEISIANVVRGTPAFMAPEQVLGDRELDGRADVYAVGCVAFWLLTGKPVFQGTSSMDLMLRHVRDVPPVPSQYTEMPVPVELDAVVARCLAKDPADRPAGADALAEALVAIAMDNPWTSASAADWWNRHAGSAGRR